MALRQGSHLIAAGLPGAGVTGRATSRPISGLGPMPPAIFGLAGL